MIGPDISLNLTGGSTGKCCASFRDYGTVIKCAVKGQAQRVCVNPMGAI